MQVPWLAHQGFRVTPAGRVSLIDIPGGLGGAKIRYSNGIGERCSNDHRAWETVLEIARSAVALAPAPDS